MLRLVQERAYSNHHLLLLLVLLQVGEPLRRTVVNRALDRGQLLPVLVLVRLHGLRVALLVADRHGPTSTVHRYVWFAYHAVCVLLGAVLFTAWKMDNGTALDKS